MSKKASFSVRIWEHGVGEGGVGGGVEFQGRAAID